MLPLVPTAVIFTGLSNHIGLAVPKPSQTVWENVTTKERNAYDIVEGNSWSKVGLLATKIIVWSCTLCELMHITLQDNPHSSAGMKLVSWLPSSVLHYLQSLHLDHSRFTLPQYIGLAFLTAGALVHMSARLSLGKYASFPLISSNTVPRMLYVPPSQILDESVSNDTIPIPTLAPQKSQVDWSLRASHRLITNGPYAYIQHPIYLGTALTFVGSGLFHFSKGSILRASLESTSVTFLRHEHLSAWGIGVVVAAALACGTLYGLMQRARWEEVALQERFGKEYAIYQWTVPFRLVPGVY